MGTRHLIAVQQGNEYKVAQYGQWDGYPEGQGQSILKFLRTRGLVTFARRVKKLSFLTEAECEAIGDNAPPELKRDTGSDILLMIQRGQCTKLYNSIDFSGDSLFCEYAYVIDLDNGAFEIYKGFNKTPLKECERFYNYNVKDSEYRPVTLFKKYSLNNLPTVVEFLEDCKEEES